MYKSFTAVMVLGILFSTPTTTSAQQAEDESQELTIENVRILFHGQKTFGTSRFGAAAWAIVSNATRDPDELFIALGPRYDGDWWWVELMGGRVIKQGAGTSVIDVRASVKMPGSLTAWTNFQWIDPAGNPALYGYLQVNRTFFDGAIAFGLETENIFGKDLSAGPNVIIPLGNATLVFAQQLHLRAGNQTRWSYQTWFRLIWHFQRDKRDN